MAGKLIERFTAATARAEVTPGLHHDGAGLYLQVRKNAKGDGVTRSWCMRYRRPGTGAPTWGGLGAFDDITLEEARKKAGTWRALLADKVDPAEHRDAKAAKARADAAKKVTFNACVEGFIRDNHKTWTNAKHAAQVQSTLKAYVSPFIGKTPVCEVETGDVVRALRPIWHEKTETATRVRQRIESVLSWAAAQGYRTGENPARREAVEAGLVRAAKIKKVEPQPALPWAQMHAFVRELRQQVGVAALALELQILTATRSGEVVDATWDEFDLGAALWTIPAERMKAKVEHRVPLSKRALEILATQTEATGGKGHVFPGGKKGKPLSNGAMLALLKRMNAARELAGEGRWTDPKLDRDIVPHGFRSAFRSWAGANTAHGFDVMERALAHTIKDKTVGAYDRDDLLEKRKPLMDDWLRFINTKPKAKETAEA